ncbi:hypothetical protein AA14337_2890 [Acetobacter malorum DSM 14337]|uniref:Uncharacterized protein n=1 Tax=Acetobacter malorum DSM 14337 TaxID=1307910 RepID=A0ABQ0PYD7_9PROT|nr:hypothetical protein [Acetobacter malorum]KXV06805.1 hypothetical protein AD930_06820 [Acetobacter malorum]GBQ84695.1 hypothetical protein AA14337_2890 [Acetobacter malorum DSM 14337]
MIIPIQAQASQFGPYNGEAPRAGNGAEVSFRKNDEEPNDYLYAIRGVLFQAHRAYLDLLSDCAENYAAPSSFISSPSLNWIGEQPGRISPQDATLLFMCGQIGQERLGLSKEMTSALQRVFPDNRALGSGEVMFSEEAYDLLCEAAGMGPELSFDPARWPDYDYDNAPCDEAPSP